ncbi:hypothetical protein ACQ4PT_066821 [Festuca glaucescens]
MSAGQIAPAEQVCYVHCNFCNTVLAVSVPGNSMLSIVTVRCGHCTNLLSVNLRGVMHSQVPPATQDHHLQLALPIQMISWVVLLRRRTNSAAHDDVLAAERPAAGTNAARTPQTPEKRQRVPSAYNRFIKEEIRRIKANNPDISHREAFSTAAKNWAHYPNIHFGLHPGRDGGSKKLAVDVDAPAAKKIHASFCS